MTNGILPVSIHGHSASLLAMALVMADDVAGVVINTPSQGSVGWSFCVLFCK